MNEKEWAPSVLIKNGLVYLERDSGYIAYPLSVRRRSRKANQLLGADLSTVEYGWKIRAKQQGVRALSTILKPTHFHLTITDSAERETDIYLTPEQVMGLQEAIDDWSEFRSLFD